ncbi:CLUMA_CG013111, isoform A [Clunio marinus]|uniref:CLUMA_CG013111, isoform A n=1 Tax=Clunio marinus TaxID=568069 RepID=A0A1J1IHW2_9DIPT|nr:CLUMA_CG013111, isoform A [Clunio marinus]
MIESMKVLVAMRTNEFTKHPITSNQLVLVCREFTLDERKAIKRIPKIFKLLKFLSVSTFMLLGYQNQTVENIYKLR